LLDAVADDVVSELEADAVAEVAVDEVVAEAEVVAEVVVDEVIAEAAAE